MVGDNRKSISFSAAGGGGCDFEGEGVSFIRIRMFRTTAEAKGEDLDPVKHV